jgi:hypothetical protein
MKHFWIRKIIFIPFIVAAIVLLLGGVVMLLWNAILPAVIHVGMLTYWQAVGLLVLSKIIFGGFLGHRGGAWGHLAKHRRDWMNMSEEDRAKLREEWKQRCQPPWSRQ